MAIYKEVIPFSSTTEVEFIDLTEHVQRVVNHSGIRDGIVLVFAQHTTMSIVINHNEPMLLQDFMRVLYRLAPQDDRYSHDMFELQKGGIKSDGRSNGHSHCKAIIAGNQVTIPLVGGRMVLTERQSILAAEFDGSRQRDVLVVVSG